MIADGVRDLLSARRASAILRRLDSQPHRLCRSDDLVAFLRRAGFSELTVTRLFGGGYAIVSACHGSAAANRST